MTSTTQTPTYPRYDRYKDSGVEWLGEIPEGWSLENIRAITELTSEKNKPDLEILSVYRDFGVIPKNSRDDNHNATSLDTSGYKVVHPGDLVINKMKAWQGSMGVSQHLGLVSPAYITCKVNQTRIHPKFLHYALRSKIYISTYNSLSYGVRVGQWDMHYEDFKKIPLSIPPVEEQNRIVNFLDQKTAAIDTAIAKKQRLIELLKEQKAILINQAVTRGLNPDVPMKDSGVEWIGEIPAHWDIVRLKHFSKVQSGITLGKVYSGEKLATCPYLRVANVQSGYFKLDDVAEITLPAKDVNKYLLQMGDILVTEGGDIDKLGRGTVWKGEIKNCLHQNHVFAVRVDHNITLPHYASLTFEADYGRKYFTTTANKTTNLASTNSTKLGNFPVLAPPVDEQQKIVIRCESISKKFDAVLQAESKSLDVLQEYKQTLIAHAVTGKIKVS